MAFPNPPKTWAFQESVESSELNTQLRDALLTTWHLIARKTSDESLASSTTYQNDDDLFFAVGANEVWRANFDIIVESAAVGDTKFQFTFPSGTFYTSIQEYESASDTKTSEFFRNATSPSSTFVIGGQGAGAPKLYVVDTLLENGGSAGNLQLQWAQSSSSATASIVKANSAIYGMKLA